MDSSVEAFLGRGARRQLSAAARPYTELNRHPPARRSKRSTEILAAAVHRSSRRGVLTDAGGCWRTTPRPRQPYSTRAMAALASAQLRTAG